MKKIWMLLLVTGLMACNSQPQNNTASGEDALEKTEALSAEWVEVTLDVEGMTCDGCEKAINAGVQSLKGVAEVESDHEQKYTRVKFDKNITSVDEISAKITDTGYEVKGEREDSAS